MHKTRARVSYWSPAACLQRCPAGVHFVFFFGLTFDFKSLDDNASAHVPCHTLCVLRPLRRLMLIEQNDCQTVVVKRPIPQVILNNKELQPITTMYFQ